MTVAVLGTDTGVGKTIVTAGIVGALRAEGHDVRAVKPAQTGYPPDDDAGTVGAICGDPELAHCCRYLEEPLAPAVAADRADTTLSYDQLYRDTVSALEETTIGVLEGVGGVRVPLTPDAELLDLVRDIGCPAIVVARPDLGTLNHTALTVEALTNRSIPVLGVVLNTYTGDTVAQKTNPETLDTMVEPPITTFPHVDRTAVVDTARHELASLIDHVLDHELARADSDVC